MKKLLVMAMMFAIALGIVTSASADSVVHTLELGAISVQDGEIICDVCNHQLQEPGAPSLPAYTTIIEIDPTLSRIDVAVEQFGAVSIGDVYLAPNETGFLPDSVLASGEYDSADMQFEVVEDPTVYDSDSEYPTRLYDATAIQLADRRAVQLTLYPVRYNPTSNTIVYNEKMIASVSLSALEATDQQKSRVATASSAATVKLPTGQTVYKIALNETGIYSLDYQTLQSAGIPVDTFNPRNMMLMHQGQEVAKRIEHDGDTSWEPGETLTFFGWEFDGTRAEKQHVINNIFWLWPTDAPTAIIDVQPSATAPNVQTSFQEELVFEPENVFANIHSDWRDSWPNEADVWYWHYMDVPATSGPQTFTFDVELPNPADSSAEFEIELKAYRRNLYNVTETMINNDIGSVITDSTYSNASYNLTTVSDQIVPGTNSVSITITPQSSQNTSIYLNAITVRYNRNLVAVNDQLIFRGSGNTVHEISDFSTSATEDILLWTLQDRLSPASVLVTPDGIEARSDSNALSVGFPLTQESDVIATTTANLLSPLSVESYFVAEAQPTFGADWVAISYGDFVEELAPLANHRARHSQLVPYIVDVEDVINQYGFGLPTPWAINNYLTEALTWSRPARYALLVGDSTFNPRQLNCNPTSACTANIASDRAFVPTHLQVADRFQGYIPTDLPFTQLDADELPDIAIGRFAVQTEAEVVNTVDKTIAYETTEGAWNFNASFLAEYPDNAGHFCNDMTLHADMYPSGYNSQLHCVTRNTTAERDDVRSSLLDRINGEGVKIVAYRGHGHISGWGSGLLNTGHIDQFDNAGKPYFSISGVCLDTFFAWPNREAFSETLNSKEGEGTVGHWGASSLGYLFEYTAMTQAFTDALHNQEAYRAGDAINIAKTHYLGLGYSKSVAKGMILLGDPALELALQPSITSVGLASGDAAPSAPSALVMTLAVAVLLVGTWSVVRKQAQIDA